MQKDTEELPYYVPGPADAPLDRVFNVNALALGASYRLASLGGARGPELSVGGQLTGYVIPETLQHSQAGRAESQFGYGKLPLSASVYVRLNAPWMSMRAMKR